MWTGGVTLSSAYSAVTTDHLTASVAFSTLVANWFWNDNHANIGDVANNSFYNFHHRMQNVVFATDASHGINQADYFDITV